MTASASTTRALITGIGAIAANGSGTEEWWRATLEGRSGLSRITGFDTTGYPAVVAGTVDGFDAAAGNIPGRLAVQTDRWTHFGLTAAELAFADAGLDPKELPDYHLGVVTGSSSGGNAFGQREIEKLWSRGPQAVGAYQSIAWFYAATTGQLSIRNGGRGPCGVLVSEQAAGLDALGQARRTLAVGDARAVLTGGTEAPLSPYALVCQGASGNLSAEPEPARAYRPFAADATGWVPGEGGAILLVEDERAAAERGAEKSYGYLAGYAATFDPAPGTGRPPALARAIRQALADAGLQPADVDAVFADAAGVPEQDRAESAALAEVFGPHGVPVTAPKSMTGRLYAGGGSLDAAAALLALRDQVLPPTAGTGEPDPAYRIDLVTDGPREARLRTVLVLARGTGGFNSAVVLRSTRD
ncbi:ketosynthase chain-length factor [Streptomyces sp. NPDC001262]|uniref:ketosynthase chain-length factor n=1 Tax=Streptomyces sp. NPDC001262 TaxID=3364552 RepID=UPI0036BB823F